MFLLLSKIADHLVAPLSWAILLAAAAALLRHRPRLAGASAAAAAAVLLACSSEVVADALARRAERGAPSTDRPEATYDVVVVLGGLQEDGPTRAHGALQLNGAGERLTRGFDVVRTGHARNLLYSSGIVDPVDGDEPESVWVVRQLEAWGIPPGRLVAEPRSRNTRENALESARILRERGWTRVLLLTSAAHMERALGCFRAVGLEPDALPVDWRGGDGRGLRWQPRASDLERSTAVLRELLGRMVYRAMGYSAPARP